MISGQSEIEVPTSATSVAIGPGPRAAELTAPGVLRFLGAGATGAILMALGGGPLRTRELTEQVPGYTPRTIYRYASKLAELGVIEREEALRVPSKVVYRLSEPCGTELQELVDAFANASLDRPPGGEIGAHAWGSFPLLAELWESGIVEKLNFGPRTTTELAQGGKELSYHQASRRASLCAIAGLIREMPDSGRQRKFELATKTRRAMALIAAIGRWRRRNAVSQGQAGLTAVETAGMLRTALPLVSLPRHAGKTFRFGILSHDHPKGDDGEPVWAAVRPDGTVDGAASPTANLDGWGRGRVKFWVDALLDGPPHDGLHLSGDSTLIKDCLSGLQATLWNPESAG